MSSDSSKSSTSDKSSNDQNFNIIQADQTYVASEDDSKSIENTTTTEASVSIDVGSILDSRLKAIDIGISNLNNDYEFLSSRMDIMNTNTCLICSKLENNELAITDLQQSLNELDTKVDNTFKSITKQMDIMTKNFTNIMTHILGTLHDVNRKIGKLSDNCDQNTADIKLIDKILIKNNLK